MSNIYIQEPPTIGKVLLVTSVGEIDIELWSKEAPKACKNFVQLCMEGYYDGTIFHRVVPDFIVQGGDPTGTGEGGESIYGAPFKDEFHTRLRFNRRGLVAMANAGPNDNGSQFFFTMGATPELQNKHSILGKVVGETIYNMIKLQDCEVDSNERPLFPYKIIKAEILSNPYDDIVPRVSRKSKSKSDEEKKPKSKSKGTKNFKLLSFGEEAEEEEHAIDKASKGMRGKSKSSHDLTNDPKLSSVPAVDVEALKPKQEKEGKRALSDSEEEGEELDKISQEELEKVRDRLRKKIKKEEKTKSEDEDDSKEEADEKKKRCEELKEEAKKLQKELSDAKKKESEQAHEPPAVSQAEEKSKKKESESEALAEFRKERQKYKDLRRQQPAKGQDRESMTLAMLAKFQDKLEGMRKATVDYSDDDEEEEKKDEEEEVDATDLSWMNHTLKFDDQKRKVLDANINDVERYEIFDPRNPITKRRRENSKKVMKEKR